MITVSSAFTVLRGMLARSMTLCLVVIGTFASFDLGAAEDSAIPEMSRESREKEAQEGFRHVRKISAPERTITADSPGRPDAAARGKKVVVIGSIADHSAREILSKVSEQFGKRAANREARVTGDERYAIVELGNRKKDPCCFSKFLFAKHETTWVLLDDIWVSH